MRRPPRPRRAAADGALVWHIVLVSMLFLGGVFGIYAYAIDKGLLGWSCRAPWR
jgi:hypothetical protein